MDAITDPRVHQVTVMKSTRIGWTKILNFTHAYFIHQDPCSMLHVQPTLEDAEGYVTDEFKPMVRDIKELSTLVYGEKGKVRSTALHQRYPGGILHCVGANSPRGFRRITTRVNTYDELDGWAPTTKEGDQESLAKKRLQTAYNWKELAGSTPTEKGLSRIERRFLKSDQRYYYVPCPSCKQLQVLVWGTKDSIGGFKWLDDRPETAYYDCAHCREGIPHTWKSWMVHRAAWQATQPFKGHAGFHIWAAYSLAPNTDWPTLAKDFLEAKHGGQETFKTFVNTTWGQTWEENRDRLNENSLLARRESYGPQIPFGVGVLTASVDAQDNRLEASLWGWGRAEEGWLIEHMVFYGDPASAKDVTWKELDEWLLKIRHHECGKPMQILMTFIDSGNWTKTVYAFTAGKQGRRVFSIKGDAGPKKNLVDRPKRKPGKADVIIIAVDRFKDQLSRSLKIKEPVEGEDGTMELFKAGYLHFPLHESINAEWFKQLSVEYPKVEYRKGKPVRSWICPSGQRNEAWDCLVYANAALYFFKMIKKVKDIGHYVDLYQGPKVEVAEKKPEEVTLVAAPRKNFQIRQGKRSGWVKGWR